MAKKYKKKENGKNATGRPEKEINWDEFEKLCKLQCTLLEMSSYFDVDNKTLEKKVKERYNQSFSEVFKLKRGKGLISLRRLQWRHAERNPAMAIFLGKNFLGQSDKQEIDHSIVSEVKIIDDIK